MIACIIIRFSETLHHRTAPWAETLVQKGIKKKKLIKLKEKKKKYL